MSTFKPAEVFHPGEFVREEMWARGWNRDKLAGLLRWRPVKLHTLCAGRLRITPASAKDLERVFGTSQEFWLNLQREYDAG